MAASLHATTYNNTNTCRCCYNQTFSYARSNGILAIVMPMSDKPLTEEDLDKKIRGLQSQIDLLGDQLKSMTISRNTHGGKSFRGKKIAVQNKQENVLSRLSVLKDAQNTVREKMKEFDGRDGMLFEHIRMGRTRKQGTS